MFDVCETWGELLCLSTLAYLGPRRVLSRSCVGGR